MATDYQRFMDRLGARKPTRMIFQKLSWFHINMNDLWTRSDDNRSANEGWAVGNMVPLNLKRRQKDCPICIGKFNGASFVSDQDAHDWVTEQARQSTPGEPNIYARALAVVAALTIKASD